jgi:hypothetical protein
MTNGLNEDVNRGRCPYCGVFVKFIQHEGYGIKRDNGELLATVVSSTCPNCGDVVVFLVRADRGWKRYPPPQPLVLPNVPARVAEAFRQAQLSLEAGAPLAGAVMVRRVVASACTDQAIPDEVGGKFVPLPKRIKQLRDKLLPVTYDAALHARLLGDAGAHEEAEDRFGEVDEQSVREAIEIVRLILDNLYEVPARVKEIKAPKET